MQIWNLIGFALLVLGKPQAPPPAQNTSTPSPAGTPPNTPGHPPNPPPPATASPTASNAPEPKGPICECGYTYCASVLKAMSEYSLQKEFRPLSCLLACARAYADFSQRSRGTPSSSPRRTAPRPTRAAPAASPSQTSTTPSTSASATRWTRRLAPTWTSCAAATSASTSGRTFADAARRRAIRPATSSGAVMVQERKMMHLFYSMC